MHMCDVVGRPGSVGYSKERSSVQAARASRLGTSTSAYDTRPVEDNTI